MAVLREPAGGSGRLLTRPPSTARNSLRQLPGLFAGKAMVGSLIVSSRSTMTSLNVGQSHGPNRTARDGDRDLPPSSWIDDPSIGTRHHQVYESGHIAARVRVRPSATF